jgi:hypothetical protein
MFDLISKILYLLYRIKLKDMVFLLNLSIVLFMIEGPEGKRCFVWDLIES